MIVGDENVTRYNLKNKSLYTLRAIQATLANYVGQGWGDVTEEKILMKLISVEIKRKVKVENVNLAAKKRSEWIVNHWDLVERRSEPLHPLHKEGPY